MCIDRSSHYSKWRFLSKLNKVSGIIGGTVCTKCVLIVPSTTDNGDLPLMLKKVSVIIRGTMCTKCVLIVPCTTVNGHLPLMLKKLVVLSEERCVQNVY